MSLGDGVFGGMAFLGIIWLYVVTRERWRWRRIILWVIGIALLPVICVGVWLGFERYTNSRPHTQTSLAGLQVGMLPADVIFHRGEPKQKGDDYWLYASDDEKVAYLVRFKDGKTRALEALTRSGDSLYLPPLQGISTDSTVDDVVAKFGQPDSVSIAADQARRWLSFSKYGVAFQLEKGKVITVGVFDPAAGPPVYQKAASSP